uniref:Uncharacterized protein n=1 Tax=Anguilla anguilla TaxID=7936 RepID=A0A0E9X888_ANGAN
MCKALCPPVTLDHRTRALEGSSDCTIMERICKHTELVGPHLIHKGALWKFEIWDRKQKKNTIQNM